MEMCPRCGNEKKMYYTPWCPRCDRPEFKTMEVYNLIKVLEYVEAQGYPGLKRRMWNYMDYQIPGNDSYIKDYLYPDELDLDEDDEYDMQVLSDLNAIMEVMGFENGKELIWEVSW